MTWEIILVPEVHDWYLALDEISASLVRDSVELLAEHGPRSAAPRRTRSPAPACTASRSYGRGQQGRPRSGSCSSSTHSAGPSLLVAGDKAGNWTRWYRDAIKLAEDRYARFLATPPEEIQ